MREERERERERERESRVKGIHSKYKLSDVVIVF
jgi:hypothetical protein